MSNLMKGKKGVVMGLANKMSIAYGIVKSLVDNGAEVILTYQGDALLKRIQPLAEELGIKTIIECDVSTDAEIEKTFKEIQGDSQQERNAAIVDWSQLELFIFQTGYIIYI